MALPFANRTPLDPAELDLALAAKAATTDLAGVQTSVVALNQRDTTIQAALDAAVVRIAALEAAGTPSGTTPPTITTDPTVAFPGGTGDPNETFTITAGTIGGGANTGTTYEVVIDGVPQGNPSASLTGTLIPAWFTGSRLFRVIQRVSWTNGSPVTRTSPTYTLNVAPTVPSTTTSPSLTGVAGTTLTRGHTTWTQGPILDYHGRFYVNGVAGPDQVTCTISNASPAVVTETTHGRSIGDQIEFGTSGALNTGLTVGTTYFIIAAGFGGSAYQVSLTSGGAAINTSSAGSGTHKVIGVTINSAAYPGANSPGVTYREQPTNATGQALSYAESDPIVIPGTATGVLNVSYSTDNPDTGEGGNKAVDTIGVYDWWVIKDQAGPNVTQRKSGGPVSASITTAGVGSFGTPGNAGAFDNGRALTWASGGTPAASGSAFGGQSWYFDLTSDTYTLTIPAADTTSRAREIYFYSLDDLTITAAWSDGSAAISPIPFVGNGSGLGTVTLTGMPTNASANLIVTFKSNTGGYAQQLNMAGVAIYAATGGGGGGGGGIVPSPLVALDSRIPFANYVSVTQPLTGTQVTVQFDGSFFPDLSSCPESGGFAPFSGSVLGNAMRFGKMTDPLTGKVCFRCAMRSTDPKEASNNNAQRVDLVMPATGFMTQGVTYWDAWDVIIPNHTYLAQQQLALFDIHPGGSIGAVGLVLINGAMSNVCQPPSGPNRYTAISQTNAPYDTRLKIVRSLRLSGTSSGFCNIWIDKGAGLVLAAADTGANMVAGDTGAYSKCAFYFSSVGGIDPARPEQEIRWFTQLSPIADAGHTKEQIAAMLTA